MSTADPVPAAEPAAVAEPAALAEPAAVVAALVGRGLTVAVAESLTGGLLLASLVSVPGASAVVRGGVVAYATDLKASLLGVSAELLAASGPVNPRVAEQMALGVRERCGADVGLATTGVAGPDGQDGHPPGEVWIGLATATGARSRRLDLIGDRSAVRQGAVNAALGELHVLLRGWGSGPGGSDRALGPAPESEQPPAQE